MNLMHKIQITIFSLLMMASGILQAGNQGVSFYYGLGIGATQVKDVVPEFDPAPTGMIVAGIEEDGWAIEYGAFTTTDTETADPNLEYSISGSQRSLSYRTVENSGMYYKFRYGNSDVDVEFKDNILNTITTSGKFWGVAVGFRMGRDERMEIEYGVYSPDSDPLNQLDDAQMLMFTYIFGGPTSNRK